MKDITLSTYLRSLSPTTAAAPVKPTGDFAATFKQTLDQVNSLQTGSDRAVEKLHSGQGQSLHEVMLTMEQADISMRLLVQMRNKVVEAYQEVMRMQV